VQCWREGTSQDQAVQEPDEEQRGPPEQKEEEEQEVEQDVQPERLSRPLSAEQLRQWLRFMQRRADRTNDAVLELLHEKLTRLVDTESTDMDPLIRQLRSEKEVRDESVQSALEAIVRDAEAVAEQVSEKKRVWDPEATKMSIQQKPFKESIERELVKWRDGVLLKGALKAVEGKLFVDKFYEGLQSAPSEASALLEVIQPTSQQIKEELHADLRQWCCAVTKNLESVVVDGGAQVKSAIDGALRELATQSGAALDRILEQTMENADMLSLSNHSNQIVEAVRRELHVWGEAPVVVQQQQQHVKESFAQRMRAAALPLQAELDESANILADARSSLELCRKHADLVESGAPDNFEARRSSVLRLMEAGNFKTALEQALQWDASHTESLVELVCERMGRSALPDEVLSQPEVADQLDGQMKMMMMCTLIQRSVSSDVAQVEVNLEWVLGLLEVTDKDVCSDAAVKMRTTLEQISSIPQISRTARMALKSLDVLMLRHR